MNSNNHEDILLRTQITNTLTEMHNSFLSDQKAADQPTVQPDKKIELLYQYLRTVAALNNNKLDIIALSSDEFKNFIETDTNLKDLLVTSFKDKEIPGEKFYNLVIKLLKELHLQKNPVEIVKKEIKALSNTLSDYDSKRGDPNENLVQLYEKICAIGRLYCSESNLTTSSNKAFEDFIHDNRSLKPFFEGISNADKIKNILINYHKNPTYEISDNSSYGYIIDETKAGLDVSNILNGREPDEIDSVRDELKESINKLLEIRPFIDEIPLDDWKKLTKLMVEHSPTSNGLTSEQSPAKDVIELNIANQFNQSMDFIYTVLNNIDDIISPIIEDNYIKYDKDIPAKNAAQFEKLLPSDLSKQQLTNLTELFTFFYQKVFTDKIFPKSKTRIDALYEIISTAIKIRTESLFSEILTNNPSIVIQPTFESKRSAAHAPIILEPRKNRLIEAIKTIIKKLKTRENKKIASVIENKVNIILHHLKHQKAKEASLALKKLTRYLKKTFPNKDITSIAQDYLPIKTPNDNFLPEFIFQNVAFTEPSESLKLGVEFLKAVLPNITALTNASGSTNSSRDAKSDIAPEISTVPSKAINTELQNEIKEMENSYNELCSVFFKTNPGLYQDHKKALASKLEAYANTFSNEPTSENIAQLHIEFHLKCLDLLTEYLKNQAPKNDNKVPEKITPSTSLIKQKQFHAEELRKCLQDAKGSAREKLNNFYVYHSKHEKVFNKQREFFLIKFFRIIAAKLSRNKTRWQAKSAALSQSVNKSRLFYNFSSANLIKPIKDKKRSSDAVVQANNDSQKKQPGHR